MRDSLVKNLCLPTFICIALYATLTLPINAQMTFEVTYGGNNPTHLEDGFRGAERVDIAGGCCDGGYIAVGRSTETQFTPQQCETDADVYVVRTDAMGGHVWEFVYDIGGPCTLDEGRCIREVQDGFVIAGTTTPLGVPNTDIFLMKIDCEGDVVYTRIFDGDGTNDFVNDLIVTEFGDGVNTFPGDFVLAGFSERGGLNQDDGLLIRTSSNGMMIWNRTYDVPGTDLAAHDDRFNAVIETRASGAGDLVAVGFTSGWSFVSGTSFGLQGLAVRVNGNTGLIGIAPQGVVQYGSANRDEIFEAVQELTTTCEAGNLVFAGHSTPQGFPQDVYLVKTAPNPCLLLAQNRLTGIGSLSDAALDLTEVLTPGLPFCAVGDLAVVGTTIRNCDLPSGPNSHTNALLISVSSSTLLGGTGFHFGSTFGCIRNEGFRSVEDLGNSDPGFFMCGFTVSNPLFISPPPPPDPSDLYLVKTGKQGRTGCEEDWDFTETDPMESAVCALAILTSPMLEDFADPSSQSRDRQEDICVGTGSIINDGRERQNPERRMPDGREKELQPGFSESLNLLTPGPSQKEEKGLEGATSGTIRAKVQMKADE